MMHNGNLRFHVDPFWMSTDGAIGKCCRQRRNPDQSQMESVMDYLHMEKMADMDDSPDQYSQLGSIKESPKNKGKSTINDLEK